jgi:phage gp29-like protein
MNTPTFWDRFKGIFLATDEFGRDGQRAAAERVGKDGPVTDQLSLSGLNATRWDVWTDELSTEWVARALRLAESGDMLAMMSLAEQMEERDPSLHSAMVTRRAGPLACDRVMLPAKAPKGRKAGQKVQFDEKRAREVADDAMWVIENISNLDGSLMDVLDSIGKGTSLSEIDWHYDIDPVTGEKVTDGTIDSIRQVSARLLGFDRETGDLYFNNNGDAMEIKKVFVKNWDFKFIVHRSKMRSGHACRAGVLRTLAWCYVFRNYAWKDQSVYCEIFGMPMRVGKYKPTATPSDKNQLAAMLKQMASNAWALISESTSIEFEEAVNRGQEPFSAFLNALRSEYFLAILGQEGTNVTNKYGSKGDTAIKQLVRQDILEADCKQLENTLKWQLIYPIVLYRWGKAIADLYCPTLHFKYEPLIERSQEAEIDHKILVQTGIGAVVAKKGIAKKYGYDVVEDGAPDEERILPADFVPGEVYSDVLTDDGSGGSTKKDGTPSKAGKKSGKPNTAKKQGDNVKRNAKLVASMSMFLSRKFMTPEEEHQEAVNKFIDLMASKADETMQSIVAPLLSILAESRSYEELRTNLEAVYADLDSDALLVALAWSMMASRLFGQKTIVEHAGA